MRIVFLHMQGVFISLFTPKVTEFSAERLPRGLIPPTKTLPDLIAERIVDHDSLAMDLHEFSLFLLRKAEADGEENLQDC